MCTCVIFPVCGSSRSRLCPQFSEYQTVSFLSMTTAWVPGIAFGVSGTEYSVTIPVCGSIFPTTSVLWLLNHNIPLESAWTSCNARSDWGNSYSVTITFVAAPRGRGNTRSGSSCAPGPRTRDRNFTRVFTSSGDVPSLRVTESVPPPVEVIPLIRITREVPEYCVIRSTIRPQLLSSYRLRKICCQEWHEEQFF